MAQNYNYGIDLPFSACGDLSAKQYYLVTHATTAERVMVSTGACNPAPMGVLQNDPKSGEEATVRIWGVSLVMADAGTAIAYGDYVTSGSDGQAVVNTSGSSVAGVALEGVSSGSGVKIKVLLLPYAGGNKTDNVP